MKEAKFKKVPLKKPVKERKQNVLIPSNCPANKDECRAASGCFCKQ